MIGLYIKPRIGVGDALQFSSLPENYFRATGEKLVDLTHPWFFDHNPFVVRNKEPFDLHVEINQKDYEYIKKESKIKLDKIVQLWNFPAKYEWPRPRSNETYLRYRDEYLPNVYLSNAEIWAAVLGVEVTLNRPRLYQFEDFPYEKREMILLHTNGRSHGEMPDYIIDHVIKKYKPTNNLYHIGNNSIDYGIPKINTANLWDLAAVISKAKMLIGVDSGPAWIAACYPDVVVKKLRTKPNPPESFKDWVPLEICNIHSFWDDRCHQIFNVAEQDIGFTYSYKRI